MDQLVSKIARYIKLPVSLWAERRLELMARAQSLGVFHGVIRVGYFNGVINKDSVLPHDPWFHHIWVEKVREKMIVDPFRWVFDATEPDIHYSNDFDNYIRQGYAHEKKLVGGEDCPDFMMSDHVLNYNKLPSSAANTIGILIKDVRFLGLISLKQLLWLANCCPIYIGSDAEVIFRWIRKSGYSAFIPTDTRKLVLGK